MPITGHGWELLLRRIEEQRHGSRVRTYGTYEVFIDGVRQANLTGYMCEPQGPGDNKVAGNKKRIERGVYPLWTQYGKYRSQGFVDGSTTPGAQPMPGIGLQATGNRSAILIHPAHPPTLFLSSVGCLNPTAALTGTGEMDFWDSRRRTIDLLNSLKTFDPTAFQSETMRRIQRASIVIEGEPTLGMPINKNVSVLSASPSPVVAHEPIELPISVNAAKRCTEWLATNFGASLRNAAEGKLYRVKHLCAIVCQETAYKWVPWIGTHSVSTIVERAVYDASGDYPDSPRNARPRNTAEFRAAFGDQFTDMLIEEANKTRRLQNYGDKPWVYKGYGLFQYDLQHVYTDEAFFRNKQWYSMDACLDRVRRELDAKLVKSKNDLWKAIRAYNGSGQRAEAYMKKVKAFTPYCAEIVGD